MDVRISVVGFKFHDWTDEYEEVLKAQFDNVNFYYLDATRKKISSWFVASLLEIFSKLTYFLFSSNMFLRAIAVSKRSWLLLEFIKRWKEHPSLIIAHNPAAFYPAFWLLKNAKVPFAIDIEDFHPGEGNNKKQQNNLAELMKRILPHASYLSFASDLIKTYTIKLLNGKNLKNSIVVNNCFSINEFLNTKVFLTNEKLQLVWFSQYIDYSRGLEKLLPILDNFKDKLQLTLIGQIRTFFYNNEIKGRGYISIKSSLPQTELHAVLNMYDVGLAIEDNTYDLNRNICLTNKIWAYFQGGLFILASDTEAQHLFIEQHTEHGICISLEKNSIVASMEKLLKDKELIRNKRDDRFEKAKLYCWENECIGLKSKWEKLLN